MRQLTIFDDESVQHCSYAKDDFIELSTNRFALRYVLAWPDWDHTSLWINGNKWSGKTHLTKVWSTMSHAVEITPAVIMSDVSLFERLETAAGFFIDPLEAVLELANSRSAGERQILKVVNFAKERNKWLILTSKPGMQQSLILNDLRSRALAIPAIALDNGRLDISQAQTLLCKLMSDNQLSIKKSQYKFVVTRLPRSFRAIKTFCELARKHVDQKTCKLGSKELHVVFEELNITNFDD